MAPAYILDTLGKCSLFDFFPLSISFCFMFLEGLIEKETHEFSLQYWPEPQVQHLPVLTKPL